MNEYNKYIDFMKDPAPKFAEYVDGLKESFIDNVIKNRFFKEYVDEQKDSLKAFENRLKLV